MKQPNRKMYLIDGVQVSQKVYFRRMQFGEHAGAKFEIVEKRGADREARGSRN